MTDTDGPSFDGRALARDAEAGRIRLDKWLWYARFFKSRSLAARLCAAGQVRIGGAPVTKAHHAIHAGEVLTFAQGRQIRVVKVLALGLRRGPASEARALYEDLAPPVPERAMPLPVPPLRRGRGTPPPKAHRSRSPRPAGGG
jgi:ribosome-associated heat shock protein Hsp15